MTFQKILLMAVTLAGLTFTACKDEGDPVVDYQYHAHIMQPSSADKNLNETLFIEVEFESHTGENVEHINVRIFKADNSAEAYNKPDEEHVPGDVSGYTFTDQVVLSTANGFSAGDWVIEAKVWGHEDGEDEEVERVEFHIHP